VSTPDTRWDFYSHVQIAEWANSARGAAVTELLEARLKSVAEVLKGSADTINGIMRHVSGGEWTGNAATLATRAMQVLRDFDDMMGHHGEMNSLAAYGQSDNSSWVKVSVPAVVDVRAPQIPTGGPIDILNSTVDYHHQVQAARDAEERARQVMREYETMTVGRIAALPPLSPPPQVVVAVSETAPRIDLGPGDGPRDRQGPPQVEKPNDPNGSETPAGQQVPPGRSSGGGSVGGDGASTDPAGVSGAQPPLVSGVSGGNTGEATRTGPVQVGGFGAVVREPGTRSLPGRPPNGAGPREVGARPGAGTRGGEVWGRGIRQAGTAGIAPVGAVGPARSDEDKDHQAKYLVPGSEIFEPDNDDGLLHDPFRPGSYVAPATIGDEDDE
jgi:hypothetical protein